MYIYMYIYTYIYTHMMYIYIYTHTYAPHICTYRQGSLAAQPSPYFTISTNFGKNIGSA